MYYTVNFHGSCRNYPLKQMSKTPWSSVVSKYVILSRINCSGSVCQHSYVEKISRMRGGGGGRSSVGYLVCVLRKKTHQM